MTRKHVNLCVPNVAAACAFFTEFFGLRAKGKGREGVFAMLEDEDGLSLVVSTITKHAEYVYPRDFQIAFPQKGPVQVDALYRRLSAAGYRIEHTPRQVQDSWRFDCKVLDLLLVEVSCPMEAFAIAASV